MKNNNTSREILMIAPWLLALGYLALVWNQLPTQMPIHYNLQGDIDGSQPKTTVAWITVASAVFMYLLLRYLPRISKRLMQSSNYQKLRFVITVLRAAGLVFMIYSGGHVLDNGVLASAIVLLSGLTLLTMGNYMTSLKTNWFIGIRTPWTLRSESVWRKTHQMAGRIMVLGGLLCIVMAFAVPTSHRLVASVVVLMATLLIPAVYSYVFFRQEKRMNLAN